jgi:hypothetical protein
MEVSQTEGINDIRKKPNPNLTEPMVRPWSSIYFKKCMNNYLNIRCGPARSVIPEPFGFSACLIAQEFPTF